MNTIRYGTMNEYKTIEFSNFVGWKLTIAILANDKFALVGETIGDSDATIAMPATLSVNWIEVSMRNSLELLSKTGRLEFKTPMGGRFDLFYSDIQAIYDFVLKNK